MHARPLGRRRALAFAAPLVLVLCAWNNVVVNRLPGYPGSYVAANGAATGALLAAARVSRLSSEDLGLAPRRLPAGLKCGGACFAVVACAYAVALAVPGLRSLLTDARVAGLDGREVAYQVLVRIPLGTVLWEEVAFRGVLLAALTRLVSVRAATATSATVFGIWHVRPTLSALAANDFSGAPLLRALAVLLACLLTGVAGVLFAWLRLRSGSLLAPALLHLATNALGTLAAAVAHRLG
ncbi:MAG: Abortive infection protein [Modestobacter sp.]|nr:Abortive infection protein [Modestobacter sp.]